jgi:hypothetical protein
VRGAALQRSPPACARSSDPEQRVGIKAGFLQQVTDTIESDLFPIGIELPEARQNRAQFIHLEIPDLRCQALAWLNMNGNRDALSPPPEQTTAPDDIHLAEKQA